MEENKEINHIKNRINPCNINAINCNSITQLEFMIKDLSYICDILNPYEKIPSELIEKLSIYNIKDLSDPFSITNKILVLLEDGIVKLSQLKSNQ